LHDEGLRDLFRRNKGGDAMAFLTGSQIYEHLEKVLDRFEDVANQVSAIVIEHLWTAHTMNSSLAAPLLIGLIATALLFDFLNGLHDAAKARQPMLEDWCKGPLAKGRLILLWFLTGAGHCLN
jgi:hypothetical protein